MSDKDDNPSAGFAGKAEGMKRAFDHADPYWKICHLEAIRIVATHKPYFTCDDVEFVRRNLHPNVTTKELRAAGPIMAQAAKLGWIIKTQDYAPTRNKAHHATPRVVWWSLIYKGPQRIRKPRVRKILDPRQFRLDL